MEKEAAMSVEPRRDLRDYALVRHTELEKYKRAHRGQLEQLCVRALAQERTIERLRDELDVERSLRAIALHDLARANAAKDPQQFIRRWENDHYERAR